MTLLITARPRGTEWSPIASLPDGKGYWIVTNTGAVQAFGKAGIYRGSVPSGASITAIASSADGNGYWLVASNGAVAAFGDARSHGSWQGKKLTAPVVAIAATPNGKGYWLATAADACCLSATRRFLRLCLPGCPHRSDRGYGGHSERERVLAGFLRRHGLQLRCREEPRQCDERGGNRPLRCPRSCRRRRNGLMRRRRQVAPRPGFGNLLRRSLSRPI